MRLLKSRVAKGLSTTIVVYHPTISKTKLITFFHEVMYYNSEGAHKETGATRVEITHDQILNLYNRYCDSLAQLKRDVSQLSDGIIITEAEDIPALMCAVSGRDPCALLLLFERSAIRGMASSGGFESHEPGMVDVVKNQIEIASSTQS